MDTIELAERAYPDLAGRIGVAGERVIGSTKSMDWSDARTTPVHRDLKMCNFLIGEERVALIDMDSVSLGDPLTDIGSLIANFISMEFAPDQISVEFERLWKCLAPPMRSCPLDSVAGPATGTQRQLSSMRSRRSIRQLDVERMKHIDDYLDSE